MEMSKKSGNYFTGLGLVAFVVMASLFLFVSDKAGVRALGIWFFGGAIWGFLTGQPVENGWQGRPASGHLPGWAATLFYLAMSALGLFMLIWPEVFVDFGFRLRM
jgi:hypothetical protein